MEYRVTTFRRMRRTALRRIDRRRRNLRNRHAQVKYRRRHVLCRMYPPRDPQNFLRCRNGRVVNPARPKNFESRPVPRARKQRQPRAPRPPVQIQTKHRIESAQGPGRRFKRRVHRRVPGKHIGKSGLDANPNFQIRPVRMQQRNRGGGQNAISQRTKPQNSDMTARFQTVDNVSLLGHVKRLGRKTLRLR